MESNQESTSVFFMDEKWIWYHIRKDIISSSRVCYHKFVISTSGWQVSTGMMVKHRTTVFYKGTAAISSHTHIFLFHCSLLSNYLEICQLHIASYYSVQTFLFPFLLCSYFLWNNQQPPPLLFHCMEISFLSVFTIFLLKVLHACKQPMSKKTERA